MVFRINILVVMEIYESVTRHFQIYDKFIALILHVNGKMFLAFN